MSVQDIYNRLRTAPLYHPSSAELFDDMTIEPGDIISVKSDDEYYALPVFANHLVWNGSAMMTVQSQGEQERKPIPALQRKLYSQGHGGYTWQRQAEGQFQQYEMHIVETDERFSRLATESEWDELAQTGHVTAWAQVTQTARELSAVVAKTGINELGEDETLYSEIVMNAEAIMTKVGKGEIASTINQTAQSVLIQASKIDLQGYVTASQLSAVQADIENLMTGHATASTLRANALYSDTLNAGSLWVDNGTAYVNATWNDVTKAGYASSNAVKYLGYGALNLDHVHGITITPGTGADAGKIFITLNSPNNTSGANTGNFNIADTQFYQDAVSAAYNRGYADGSASSTKTVASLARDSTRQTTYASAMYTVPVIVTYTDGTTSNSTIGVSISTGSYVASTKQYTITVAGNSDRKLTATAAYNAGRDDNSGIQSLTMVAITQEGWDNQYASVTTRTVSSGRRYLVTATPKYGSMSRFKFKMPDAS